MKNKKLVLFAAALAAASTVHANGACCAAGAGTASAPQGAAGHPAIEHTGHAASAGAVALVTPYEALSSAVFDGDVEAIRAAAGRLAAVSSEQGRDALAAQAHKLAEVSDAEAARVAFVGLSAQLIEEVDSEPGFYVMACPMVDNGKWLQTSKEVHNPYMGNRMARCGFVDHATGSQTEHQ